MNGDTDMSHQHSLDLEERDTMTQDGVGAPDHPVQLAEGKRNRPTSASNDPGVTASREVIEALFGPVSERTFAVRYWDGSCEPAGATTTPAFTMSFDRPGALRRMLLPPSELSIVEAYLSGDVGVDGDLAATIDLGDAIGRRVQSAAAYARLLPKIMALPSDPSTAPQELKQNRFAGGLTRFRRSRRHGGAEAIQHHYDVGNDFYSLWLDPRMLYTCAYFEREDEDVVTAQQEKNDYLCRKLRLEPGMKMLDVGCGWGALVMHAAQHYGVEAVGITLSKEQVALATERIAAAGLANRCRVELRDYRDLGNTPEFDRIASIGMMEHVRADLQPAYFATMFRLLRPRGVILNHCLTSVSRALPRTAMEKIKARLWRRDAFIDKYVFPDGRLVPVGHIVSCAESVGFELRDIESLREHYVMTLKQWVRPLIEHEAEAVRVVGERIYRIWRLYLAAGQNSLSKGSVSLIQALLVKPDSNGASGIPLTREYMYDKRGPTAVSSGAAA